SNEMAARGPGRLLLAVTLRVGTRPFADDLWRGWRDPAILIAGWGPAPQGAARGLTFHDLGHPLGPRRGDGPAPPRHLVHNVGKGDAAIHVDDHTGAARAAPGTHPAFRGQAITDAELERYADHEVDPVALHFEDPVDRLW